MRSIFAAQLVVALLVANCAFGTELITIDSGQGTSAGGTGLTISNNFCTQCVRDGDLNTSWDVTASSLLTVNGQMNASAEPFLLHVAHVDTVTLRMLLQVTNTAGSTRLNQGSYQLQYRLADATYVTLLSDSFGPVGGDSPVSISYNATVSGLDLDNVRALRLLANASTTEGNGKATFQLRVFQISATGQFVPEPCTAGLLVLGATLTFVRRHKRK
jgi:hypothetical protein